MCDGQGQGHWSKVKVTRSKNFFLWDVIILLGSAEEARKWPGMEITEKFCLSLGKVSEISACPPLFLPVHNYTRHIGKFKKAKFKTFLCLKYLPVHLNFYLSRTGSNFHPWVTDILRNMMQFHLFCFWTTSPICLLTNLTYASGIVYIKGQKSNWPFGHSICIALHCIVIAFLDYFSCIWICYSLGIVT